MKVNFALKPYAFLPSHAYGGSQHDNVGMDLYASEVPTWETLPTGVLRCVVSTGLTPELPKGYHMRVAGRSGLAFKNDILAFEGTIDSAFRSEIKVLLYSLSGYPVDIKIGDRIAQAIIFKSVDYDGIVGEYREANTDTIRGTAGFGSSG